MTRYVGTFTDHSWIKTIFKLSTEERRKYIPNDISRLKLDEGLNFIYSLNRLPRIYLDEYNNKGE